MLKGQTHRGGSGKQRDDRVSLWGFFQISNIFEITAENVEAAGKARNSRKMGSRALDISIGTSSSLSLNMISMDWYLCDGTWSVAETELTPHPAARDGSELLNAFDSAEKIYQQF
jgi:hypothetical protein